MSSSRWLLASGGFCGEQAKNPSPTTQRPNTTYGSGASPAFFGCLFHSQLDFCLSQGLSIFGRAENSVDAGGAACLAAAALPSAFQSMPARGGVVDGVDSAGAVMVVEAGSAGGCGVSGCVCDGGAAGMRLDRGEVGAGSARGAGSRVCCRGQRLRNTSCSSGSSRDARHPHANSSTSGTCASSTSAIAVGRNFAEGAGRILSQTRARGIGSMVQVRRTRVSRNRGEKALLQCLPFPAGL